MGSPPKYRQHDESRWRSGLAVGLVRAAAIGVTALLLGVLPNLVDGGLQAQVPPSPALVVTGTLVDEEGAPVAGLEVSLRPYPSRYERLLNELGDTAALPVAVDSTRSGPGGTFALTAPAVGPYRLEVSATAEGPAEEAPHVTPSPLFHTLAPLVAPIVLPPIEVPRWKALTVAARDSKGQPVEGAIVVADPGRSKPVDLGRRQEPSQRRQERVRPQFGRAVGRTNAAGLTSFSLPSAPADVVLSAPGFRLREGRVGSSGGFFELVPSAAVTVRVLDPEGRPFPGAALVAAGRHQDIPLALTNDRGEATVGLAGRQSLVYKAIVADNSLGWAAPLGPEAGASGAPRTVEIELEPPEEIAGRITDAVTGRPVAGAAVWNRPGEQTRSGPTGAFVLRAWLDRSQAQLGIAADGYQPTTAMVEVERLRPGIGADIVVTPSAPLRGEVLDASGSSVAGAWLRIEPLAGSGGLSIGLGGWEAVSAYDGSFLIAGAASGYAYRLHVEAAGYAGTTLAVPAVPEGEAREDVRVVLTRGQNVRGIATDAQGTPISNVEVALLAVARARNGGYSWNSAGRRTTSTDADGAFQFSGTRAGRYELTANHPDHVSVPTIALDVPSGEGTKNVGVLTLDAGTPVEGVVRDFSGDPVGGARVSAHQENTFHRRLRDPGVKAAVTGADGRFRIGGLKAAPVDLVVEAEGYARFDMTALRPQGGSLVEVQLSEGALLAGRVVSADSQGTANAFVVLNLDHNAIAPPGVWSPLRSGHHTRTDAEGRFHFGSLGPGPWSLQVAGEHLAEDVGAIRLRPGEEREIEVHLRVQSRIAGVVVDSSGAPVTGAEVIVQSLDPAGDPESTDSSLVTDAGGGYEASRVPPGTARIVARHPAYQDGAREVEIGPGTNEVNLELPFGWEISGSVTTAGGTRVALASVEAHPLEEQAEDWGRFLPRPLQAVTDENGTYRIGGLDEGRYNLHVEAEGYARAVPSRFPVRVEGAPVTGVDFVVHPGITLQGVVTGRPPEAFGGILVRAVHEHILGGETTPDLAGRFQLNELGPGTWTVRAEERDGRAVERSVTLETGPGEAFVELSFEAGLTLTGEVRSQGQPLAGREVTIRAGGQEYDQVRTARIDQQNRFRVEGLAAGTYRVMIAEPSGVTHSRHIELQGHQHILVDLTLPAVLVGVVVDRTTREPLADVSLFATGVNRRAEVSLAEDQWPPAGYTWSNSEGKFALHLAPGESTSLVVRREGYEGFGLTLDLVPGERREGLVIELQPE